jgi:hypothetical protein
MLTPDQKGSIAEMEIATAAVKLGVGVFKPLSDGHRYDLIFDLGERLARIQCKWANKHGDVVVVRCRSCRRTADGYLRRQYSADEVDVIAASCPDADQCYWLPIERFSDQAAVYLRLGPPRTTSEPRSTGLKTSPSKLH